MPILQTKWAEADHPRADDGRFGEGAGEHSGESKPGGKPKPHGDSSGDGGKPRRQPKPQTKQVARLNRFRAAAIKHRVRKGLRNEGELSQAIDGHNLPDSEPADVVTLVNPGGEVITNPEQIKKHLVTREHAVRKLADKDTPPEYKATLKEWIDGHELHFYEVKTLVTQSGSGAIHMSPAAVKRKKRWEKKYQAPFSTVAMDDRKGKKHSGNRLYYKAGVGSSKLADMTPVKSFEEIVAKTQEAKGRRA